MKFTLGIDKKNRGNIGQAQGHNARSHATKSQLPKPAWLTPKGLHTIKAWDAKLVDEAKDLAKRKDAVLAIELVFQVGNQTDWREVPDREHPEGKPRRGNSARMNALIAGVNAAVASEIGWDRVISAELHTDESSPHLHVIFAPIQEGKLQQKHWVDGPKMCGQLRERLHAQVTKHLPCEYTKGAAGGEPHDPEKAAGKRTNAGEVASLKTTIAMLEQQVQTLFSQLKAEQKKGLRERAEMDDFTDKAAKRIEALQAELTRLKPPAQAQARSAATQRSVDENNDASGGARRVASSPGVPGPKGP